MSTITDTGVEALRARVGATLARRLDAHIERLYWDAAQLEQFQRDELRTLLSPRRRAVPVSCAAPGRDRS